MAAATVVVCSCLLLLSWRSPASGPCRLPSLSRDQHQPCPPLQHNNANKQQQRPAAPPRLPLGVRPQARGAAARPPHAAHRAARRPARVQQGGGGGCWSRHCTRHTPSPLLPPSRPPVVPSSRAWSARRCRRTQKARPPTPPTRTRKHTRAHALSRQVAARLGGRVRVVLSGGAPLAPRVEEFMRVALCAPVAQVGRGCLGRCVVLCVGCVLLCLGGVEPCMTSQRVLCPDAATTTINNTPQQNKQGYGLTECCAGATIADGDDWAASFATSGAPLPCIELCLESVPGARAFCRPAASLLLLPPAPRLCLCPSPCLLSYAPSLRSVSTQKRKPTTHANNDKLQPHNTNTTTTQ